MNFSMNKYHKYIYSVHHCMTDESHDKKDTKEEEEYINLWKSLSSVKPIEVKNEQPLFSPWKKKSVIPLKLPPAYYYYKRR